MQWSNGGRHRLLARAKGWRRAIMLETNIKLVLGHLIKTMMFIDDTEYLGFFWDFS